ncbi:Protein of unknown function [Cotesia congregata]|uniref:Uncharacterized protein n=1 Tax=Cotesia congregata TaxID=51543 RepID=A0A8J2HQ85_COTCN|nr:Protein of unknown function [Cotesia congregata]
MVDRLTDDELNRLSMTAVEAAQNQGYRLWHEITNLNSLIFEMYPEVLQHEYHTGNRYTTAHASYTTLETRIATRKDAIQEEIDARDAEQAQNTLAMHSTAYMSGSSGTGLPKIKLHTFSGDFKRWGSFSQLFPDIVIDNALLKNSQKMHYLKTFTEKEAHQLIGNMPSTDDSFEPAWNLLKSRYSNPRRVVASHLEDLLVGESVPARSAAKLDALLLSNQKALDSIKAQGVPVNNWDLMIIHLTLRRLPPAVREDWETSLGLTDIMPTYTQLHEFLKSKVRAWENLEPASEPKKQPENHKSGGSRSDKQPRTKSSYTAAHQCDLKHSNVQLSSWNHVFDSVL